MRRRAVVAIIAGAAAVAVGGGVAVWALSRPPDARDAAMRYLHALQAGDMGAVTAMQSSPLDDDAQQLLATAFASAAEYVSAPRIERLGNEADGSTSVRATVELAGERRAVSFAIDGEDGRWLLTGDYLGSVTVTTTIGDSVSIGDAMAPAGEASIALLPAVYSIAASPRDILAGDATAIVTTEGPIDIDVPASFAPGATAVAQQQLEQYEDACTTTADAVPDHCGLRVPWAADLASLSTLAWRIDRRPTVMLAPDGAAFAATGGIVVATATGTTPQGTTASFTYRADDWALRGSVTVASQTMTLAVD